ncbi:MAG: beta-ketoacyl-[acyl-carrier-protein] synthase II, partial [Verrucomicrobia bacterium]|nr:beta-ketoacyl-[acyl-carrier-protein] synthase II [Verrucomicrobiota bacterium]
IKMNGTKSMIGHGLGAAGGLEAVATIKAILTGMLHPTINLTNPEEGVEGIDLVPNVAKPHKVKVALSNSFGFGGHNSSILFAPYIL